MMLISKLTLISSMLIFSLILKVRGGIKISVLKHHLEFLYKNSWYIVLDSETLKHRSPKCHNYQVKLPKMTVEHRSQRIICACAPVGGSQWFAMWASLPNLISLPQSCEASPVLLQICKIIYAFQFPNVHLILCDLYDGQCRMGNQ